MKKTVLFIAGLALCTLGFASAPKTNNHGFALESQAKAVVVEEQVATEAVVAEEVVAPAQKTVANKPSKKVKFTKEEKKAVKNFVKEVKKMNDSERAELNNNLPDNPAVANAAEADQVVLVLLSIFIPPLAVFLNNGLGTEFWIDLILTILGWLPGMIYALLLVLGVI